MNTIGRVVPSLVVLLVLVGAALAIGLAGWGQQGQLNAPLVDNSPNAGLSNKELISTAITNMKALKSYHFELTGAVPSTNSGAGSDITMAADVQLYGKGSRYAVKADVGEIFGGPAAETGTRDMAVIVTGGRTYESYDGGNMWSDPQVDTPLGYLRAGLECAWGNLHSNDEYEAVRDPSECEEVASYLDFKDATPRLEMIDGVLTRHMVGMRSGDRPETSGQSLKADIWVSTDKTPLIRRLQTATTREAGAQPITLIWHWSRFNEDFGDIKPPMESDDDGSSPFVDATPTAAIEDFPFVESPDVDVYSVAFSPDGKTLASGAGDGTIKMWSMADGRELRTLSSNSEQVYSVAFSPDGKALASGLGDHTIRLWDVNTGKEIRTLSGHDFEVRSVAFSPDGNVLASGAGTNIKLWKVNTGKEIRTLSGHYGAVYSVAFSPDGKTLASGSNDNFVMMWDIESGKQIQSIHDHSFLVLSVAFSPDGKLLASGSWDRTIKLRDAVTGKEIRTPLGYYGRIYSVAFSPDGKTIASGSDDNIIKLWDVESGTEIRTLVGHTGTVNSVAFSPDGRTLASGSEDRTVKLWNVMDGQEIRALLASDPK
jgi:WD40 repeat protein